ncbi:cytochrome P450 4V2 isoform X2 [Rhipicephalus microplus]|uniref:cytochrome P450 4V2 isoform X2 n=1 Tax=Rhipicephalus microplus TaxID=6941 RepID=UPI003F6AB2B7
MVQDQRACTLGRRAVNTYRRLEGAARVDRHAVSLHYQIFSQTAGQFMAAEKKVPGKTNEARHKESTIRHHSAQHRPAMREPTGSLQVFPPSRMLISLFDFLAWRYGGDEGSLAPLRRIRPASPGQSLGSRTLEAMMNTVASVRTYSLWLWLSCRALAALLLAYGAAKLVLWCWHQYELFRSLKDIPGPGGCCALLFTPRYFLHSLSTNPKRAGSTVEFFQWIRGLSEIHRPKGVFKIYAGLYPIVFLCTAETAEPLLSSTSNLKKSVIYDNMHPWLGSGGLLTSYGDRWRQHRKLLTPAFHFRVLDNFLPIINEQGDRLVQELSQLASETYVNLFPTLSKCALSTICETAMGLKVHSKESTSAVYEYERDLETAIKLFMKRVLQPWTWLDVVYSATSRGVKFGEVVKRLHCFTTKVIVERQKAEAARHSAGNNEAKEGVLDIDGGGGKTLVVPHDTASALTETGAERPAFLDLLSHYYRQGIFSVEDMRQEVDTFMFAGHDTSAQTLTWTLFALAINPGVQRKVHAELDSVFGKRAAGDITKSHVTKLTYLDRVLKETIRFLKGAPVTCLLTASTATPPTTRTRRRLTQTVSCPKTAAETTPSLLCLFPLALETASARSSPCWS